MVRFSSLTRAHKPSHIGRGDKRVWTPGNIIIVQGSITIVGLPLWNFHAPTQTTYHYSLLVWELETNMVAFHFWESFEINECHPSSNWDETIKVASTEKGSKFQVDHPIWTSMYILYNREGVGRIFIPDDYLLKANLKEAWEDDGKFLFLTFQIILGEGLC